VLHRVLSRVPSVVRLVLAVAGGWVAVWVVSLVVPFSVVSSSGRAVLLVVVSAWSALLLAWAWWGHRRGRTSEQVARTVVAGTSVLLAGSATLALHGTRWGYNALWSDASFRTEAATRYADSWRLTDYAYAGAPPYYPPLLGWLQGRTAALLDVPAWTVMKPSQVLLAALVPLLAWCLWRRLVPPLQAALVVAATAVLTAHPLKSDEWLVVVCAVPWWMDLVRGVRAPGVRRWPWWGHGLVGGVVLLTHTFFLLPLAVATVVGWTVDAARRRRPELGVRRAAGVVAVGLLVASPYWVPQVLVRLRGDPTDSFQLRYSFPGADVPPWPLPTSVEGTLGLIGVCWLVWSLRAWRVHGRRDPLAGAVAVAWVGALLTMGVGAVAARHDVGLLTFKTGELVILVMAAAGVSGLVVSSREFASRGSVPRAVRLGAGAVALLLAAGVGLDHAGHNVVGRSVRAAQATTYPDGTRPEGGLGLPAGLDGPAFSGYDDPGTPSTEEVRAAWLDLTGRPLGAGTVLVTTRVDLLATTPVHPFLTWKSIYSNPLGRFGPRLELLRDVARCPDTGCARRLLLGNPYDRVDGLVLARRGDELVMPVLVDDFPDRSLTTEVAFPASLFDGPGFETTAVGPVAVVVTSP